MPGRATAVSMAIHTIYPCIKVTHKVILLRVLLCADNALYYSAVKQEHTRPEKCLTIIR